MPGVIRSANTLNTHLEKIINILHVFVKFRRNTKLLNEILSVKNIVLVNRKDTLLCVR